jgi:4a-hydroxytetrahydrobiopterin dehydratase
MTVQTAEQLSSKRCAACDGGVEKLSESQAREQMNALAGWRLIGGNQQLHKDWKAKNFLAGMEFINQVAELAEQEGHHPNLHLEDYRHVWIALSTHAIGGLSENDFILAAKIDQLADSARLSVWEPN